MSEGLQIPSASGGSTKGQFIPSSASNQRKAERDAIAFLQAQQPTADDRNRLQRIEVMAEARRADDGGESLLPKASPVENRQSDNADYQTGRRIGQAVQSKAVNAAENTANRIANAAIDRATGEAVGAINSTAGRIAEASGITGALDAVGEFLGGAANKVLAPINRALDQDDLQNHLRSQGHSALEQIATMKALENAGLPVSIAGLNQLNEQQAQQQIGKDSDREYLLAERAIERAKGGGGPPCDFPDQEDSIGRRCGGRSAVSRSGGRFG